MIEQKKDPLITVVVPVYNGERYIRECIQSIQEQDYKNIEILVIDDGSTDGSKSIVEALIQNDSRIKLISQKNAGVSTARNTGIKNAKGEYICFNDVDDYVSKDYVSYFYKLIKQNNAQIALTPMPRRFNESTKNVSLEETEDHIELWSGIKAAEQMLYYNIVIAPWNKMISCKLIKENNLWFNPNLSFGEGFNFSIDCFQRAEKVAVGHRKVYHYRVDNPNSVMTKFSLNLVYGSIEAQKTIQKNLVEATENLLKACKYSNWHTHCDCLNTIIGSKVEKKYKKEYQEVKKVCQKDALCALTSPINKKEKLKGILYFISPYFAAKIINHFRIRKFTIE